MNAFTVRHAEESDDATLFWLGALAGQVPVRRPALIGDVDGVPAAAISVVDGRVVEDPYRPAFGLASHLRLYRSGWRIRAGRDGALRRVRAALPLM